MQNTVEDFKIPIGFHLDENNRWVILSRLIPWQQFEEEYIEKFRSNQRII